MTMQKPGQADGGFISDEDLDGVAGCIEEVEEILGPLDHFQKSGLNVIIRNYYHQTEQTHGQPLKPTRTALDDIVRQCRDLQKSLYDARREPSVSKALTLAEIEDFLPAGGPGIVDVEKGLDDQLKNLQAYAEQALEKLPTTKRWPNELTPRKELVKNLSIFYEDVTGKPAKTGISHEWHAPKDEKKYRDGPFLKLIEAVFDFLNIEYGKNDAFGNMIFRYIK